MIIFENSIDLQLILNILITFCTNSRFSSLHKKTNARSALRFVPLQIELPAKFLFFPVIRKVFM